MKYGLHVDENGILDGSWEANADACPPGYFDVAKELYYQMLGDFTHKYGGRHKWRAVDGQFLMIPDERPTFAFEVSSSSVSVGGPPVEVKITALNSVGERDFNYSERATINCGFASVPVVFSSGIAAFSVPTFAVISLSFTHCRDYLVRENVRVEVVNGDS